MHIAEALNITHGVTAIIGSGGKTTLLLRLAEELRAQGSVIVTTTTHIYPPKNIPIVERVERVDGCVCVGVACENGKLKAPPQSIEELSALADFVLVEADGSKHLPLKAHLPHEPVVPQGSHIICVVGASGLFGPIERVVHRAERFSELTNSEIATPQAVALALESENLAHRYLINQVDANEAAARELAALLNKPCVLASLEKGELLCSY